MGHSVRGTTQSKTKNLISGKLHLHATDGSLDLASGRPRALPLPPGPELRSHAGKVDGKEAGGVASAHHKGLLGWQLAISRGAPESIQC